MLAPTRSDGVGIQKPIRSVLGDDGTVTVSVHGEIDFSNADDVAEGVRGALAECSPSLLRVELGKAAFIDSTGLGALIESYRAATGAQCRFVVINPTDSVRRVLVVTGLNELFGLAAASEGKPLWDASPNLAV